jgi:hypothetical protein
MANELPQTSAGDNLHLAVRAAIAAIPTVGGSALELFNHMIAPPIQKRRDAWLNELANRVARLEQDDHLNIDDLATNDQFISTVTQASVIALRNHRKEKIDALRNTVLNTAIGQSPEDSKREMFVNLVDLFTVEHLRVLHILHERDGSDEYIQARAKTNITGIAEMAVKEIPPLRGQPALATVIVDELCRRGLLHWTPDGVVTFRERGETLVTDLGIEFLTFISDPGK